MRNDTDKSETRPMLGVLAGANLALSLLPGARSRVVLLMALGIATSILDTMAIGVVILVLQFALDTSNAVEGYGALGLVVNFAHGLAQQPIWIVAAVVFGILLFHSLLGASYEGLTSHLRLQAYQTFRERVFANWVGSEMDTLEQKGPGTMVNTIQNETWEAADAVFQYCTLAIAGAIAAVYVLVMAATSLILTGVAALLAILAVALVALVRRRLWQHSQSSIEQKEALARHFIGNLNALRTIKAFRAEDAALAKSHSLSSSLRRTFESIVLLETAIKPVASLVNAFVLGTVLLVAWRLSVPGTVILGFVIVLYRAQPRVQLLVQTLGRLAKTLPSVAKVSEHLQPVRKPRTDGTLPFHGFEHEIRFSGVDYVYPGADEPVLRNLDLVLRKGEMTTVLGSSGAGKSTMINLLLRFVVPSRGVVECDGTPISSFTRSSWLGRVAVAGQDVELIDGTVRDNLLMGNSSATENEIWQALEVAGAADLVRGLPRGLDAETGSRGVSLSGGQRQRLCLARALLVDTEILILDEATNAVDAVMEQAIYTRIRSAYPRLTMLVIAHRAAIGKLAEHVAVMADGRVIEYGAPEELLRRREGAFAKLDGAAAERRWVQEPEASAALATEAPA